VHRSIAFFVAISSAILSAAASAFAAHPFICCDHNGNKVCVVSADGKIEWQYDCWKLPSGNYLFCFLGGALELTPDKEKKFEYKAPSGSEVHACQPLTDGNIMLVEGGSSRILELDHDAKIVKEIKLTTLPSIKAHEQYRGTRKTKDGHYFVCFKSEHKIVELDGDGKQLREIKVPGDPHEVLLLPNNHLLIDCGEGHKVIELDENEKVVWQLDENELPGNPLRLMAGCQRLPNGNTIFCNYLGHGHIGGQPQFFELTPDKKVVWQFDDHAHFKTINQIQVLDVPGDVTNGEILR
jgi:hypothetical protein